MGTRCKTAASKDCIFLYLGVKVSHRLTNTALAIATNRFQLPSIPSTVAPQENMIAAPINEATALFESRIERTPGRLALSLGMKAREAKPKPTVVAISKVMLYTFVHSDAIISPKQNPINPQQNAELAATT